MNTHNYSKVKRRSFLIVLITLAFFMIYAIQLFQVQIVEGEKYRKISENHTIITVPISASRGEILDRNLRPLAINRTSYEIVFDYAFFPHSKNEKKQAVQNDIIRLLSQLLSKQQKEWYDELPISKELPFSFVENTKNKHDVAKLFERLKMADYATAENCLTALSERYDLAQYSLEEQRIIAGVRYKMEFSDFSYKIPYTFAPDVDEFVYNKILENSEIYKGVNVQTVAVREYLNGEIAAHLRGVVGKIPEENYTEHYKTKGYSYDDIVGVSGMEYAFEDTLRGQDGVSTIIKNSTGEIVSVETTKPAISGDTVILSLDSQLQLTAQNILDTNIKNLRASAASHRGKEVKNGAVVVIDVKTGGVLAAATWPNYDINNYFTNYKELLEDPENPLYNRALMGVYPIGSTAKPGVAVAALQEGAINVSSTPFFCNSKFYISDSEFIRCLGFHSNISVLSALQKSCNCFFLQCGKLLGHERLNYYLNALGLGTKTGVELEKEESSGGLPSPQFNKKLNVPWYVSDGYQTGIGQATTSITPIQLATYSAALANDGIRYKTHFLQSVRHFDGSISVTKPTIVADAKLSKNTIDSVREGMIRVTKTGGTAARFFGNYPVSVAAKTGTAETHTDFAHGTFICYSPVEEPEVAIGVIMEFAGSAASMAVAKEVLDAYYALKSNVQSPTPQGVLIR